MSLSSSTGSPSVDGAPASTNPPALNGHAFARDGLLFLGLGSLALLVAVAMIFILVPDQNENLEILQGIGVGLTSCLVLTGLGLWKLTRARMAGVQTATARIAAVLVWIYAVLAIGVICGYLVPLFFRPFLNTYTSIVAWSMPAALFGAILLWKFLVFRHDPLRRGFCVLAAGYVAFIASIGISSTDLIDSLVYRPEFIPLGYPEIYGMAIPLLCIIYSLFNFRVMRFKNIQSAAVPWLKRATLVFAGLLLIAGASFSNLGDYWATAALVILGAIAWTSGRFLAGIQQSGKPSSLRRIVFALPLLLAAVVVALGFKFVGDAFYLNDYIFGENQNTFPYPHTWAWHVPEFVRGPIATKVGQIRGVEANLLATGMLSVADLRTEATSSKPKYPFLSTQVWMAWASRDPNALAAALALPPRPKGSPPPAWSCETAAGAVVGAFGSNSDIRRSLDGTYSDGFTAGVLLTLPKERASELKTDVVSYFQHQVSCAACWYAFTRRFPGEAKPILAAEIQSSQPNYALLEASSQQWLSRDFDGLITLAIASDDPKLRKIALISLAYQSEAVKKEMKALLAIARGQVRNPDPNEERAVAAILSYTFKLPGSTVSNYRLMTNTPPIPLVAVEKADIQHICDAAQAWLDRYGK